MSIEELNQLPEAALREELGKCCGASRWIDLMGAVFPVRDAAELLRAADEKWAECGEADWLEAFTHHPKIGDVGMLKKKFASTADWASTEQAGVQSATDEMIQDFVKANEDYLQKFGFIFIVCATGKSAFEMLEMLHKRMRNERADELVIAAGEQAKITQIRLQKLLA